MVPSGGANGRHAGDHLPPHQPSARRRPGRYAAALRPRAWLPGLLALLAVARPAQGLHQGQPRHAAPAAPGRERAVTAQGLLAPQNGQPSSAVRLAPDLAESADGEVPVVKRINWLDPFAPHQPATLAGRVCARTVPSKFGLGSCQFISQTRCKGVNTTVADLTGGFAQCLAQKPRCAMVGSSAHLLDASFGREIDGHEEVFRLNGAPAGGSEHPEFTAHVGSRTTARFVNKVGRLPNEDRNSGMCVFLHNPKVPCRTCSGICATQIQKREQDWGRNYVFLDLVHWSMAHWISLKPTAGFTALAHLLHTCEEVTVYGFGPSCKGEHGVRYFDDIRDAPGRSFHRYRQEFGFLQSVVKDGNLGRFFEGVPGRESWVRTKNLTLRLPECLGDEH